MATPRISRRSRSSKVGRALCLGAVLAGSALLGPAASAQSKPAEQANELSSAASDELGKIREAITADDPKTYPELLRKVDEIIAKLQLKGYDLAYINQIKVNLLIKSGKSLQAIEPLEQVVSGSFFPKDAQTGMTLALAQLYMQDAGVTNNEQFRQKRLGQARQRLEEWLAAVPEPMLGAANMQSYIDATFFYANCLYYLKDYKKSFETAKKLVQLSIEPTDQAWVLLFAAQQESGDAAAAAETFEMFVRKFPEKKDIWLQLTQAYLSSNQHLRAILTYQRAQARGFQNKPEDYRNVFNLYYTLEEYSRASQLLESWIKEGKVDDSEDNWELVSVCMANLRRDDAVRKILDESRTRFKTGNLDFQLAQYLWYDGKYKEGLEVAETAWKKGGLKKPGKTALFLSTAYLERRDYDKAFKLFDIAKTSGEVDKSDTERIGRMMDEAKRILAERAAEAEAEKAKPSS